MSRDDRIPFNDDEPRAFRDRDIEFEIGEEALRPRGPFAEEESHPDEEAFTEYQPTKIMPSLDETEPERRYAQDAPTQRIGTAGHRPTASRPPARERRSAYAGNAEYTAPSRTAPQGGVPVEYGHPHGTARPVSRRELSEAGWARLLFGGLALLVATWLLVHGSLDFIDQQPAEALLNPFTLIGAPLLLASLLLLPGPAGGKVMAIVFAALAYGALILPGFLGFDPAITPEVPPLIFATGPAVVLFGFMTWLSVRGKRPLAWSLLPLPPIIAIVWALAAGAYGSMGIIYAGDWLVQLQSMGLAPWLDWMTLLPLEFVRSTLRFATIGVCVAPAVLLAWPFARAKLVRARVR